MIPKHSIYLDYNATTPAHSEVIKAMLPFYKDEYGNASSIHKKGRAAHAALEDARSIIGNSLGTESVDIVFTSGGTESNNLAIKGVCFKNKDHGNPASPAGGHIITSSIEHMAVLEPCKFMQSQGFDLTCVNVDEYGLVDPLDIEKAITDKTVLVSIMYANNEIGTIQPIQEIAEVIKRANAIRNTHNAPRIYLHTDAVQAFSKIPLDVEALGVDLLSISAHKLYGPKGVGALYIRKGTEIAPLLSGGYHERGLRAGTENIPAIVGFGKAVLLARKSLNQNKNIEILRDKLYEGLNQKIKDIKLNGHPTKRLFNTLSVSFKGLNEESIIVNLDLKGIFASAGSACSSGSIESSHVLEAMGVSKEWIKGSIRFSLGSSTTDRDISYCLKEVPSIIEHLRSISLK